MRTSGTRWPCGKQFVDVLDRDQPISAFQEDLKLIADIDSYVHDAGMLHFK